MAIKPTEIARVKSMGFLLNRGTECFSGRVVPVGGIFSAKELAVLSTLADRFGNGKVAFTSRLTAEIVGIPYENIPAAVAFAEQEGLSFGGTGAKIRPVSVCKGTTCIYGNFDTQALAAELHNRYYLGWRNVTLPHKFKIAVGGCPNSCMKPALNDFGVEGRRAPRYDAAGCRGCNVCQVVKACPVGAAVMDKDKLVINGTQCKLCGVCTGKCPFRAVEHHDETQYQIYVGGTWGKFPRIGTPLSKLADENDIFPLLEKTMLWFKDNAYQKERLGAAIDRVGVKEFERVLFSDELTRRKDEILAADVKVRP